MHAYYVTYDGRWEKLSVLPHSFIALPQVLNMSWSFFVRKENHLIIKTIIILLILLPHISDRNQRETNSARLGLRTRAALDLSYEPRALELTVNENVTTEFWLLAPLHRINGNKNHQSD
jgi:hypothetical protein